MASPRGEVDPRRSPAWLPVGASQHRLLVAIIAVSFVVVGLIQLISFSSGSSQDLGFGLAGLGAVKTVTLKNEAGVEVTILTLGAVVQKLRVPDNKGKFDDVVLGFDDVTPYKDGTSPYFGATVGRVANRIANARFNLDGKTYNLSANDPPNSLHGGTWGWSRRPWTVLARESFDDGGSSVQLGYTSAAGEEGYPGTVKAAVTFSLLGAGTLQMDFEAVADAATPINMAQHAYFNLDGVSQQGTILDHTIQINSSFYTPVDETFIPTGEVLPVQATALDLRQPQRIGDHISEVPGPPPGGYDVNFVLWGRDLKQAFEHTKDCVALSEPGLAARLHSPASGRTLEVLTTSPGLQFYSGNQLDSSIKGKGGIVYQQYGGLALETQMFPNFVNTPSFPQCDLRPGSHYHVVDIWRFSTDT